MIRGLITDWKLIGAYLAQADDNDQAAFFSAFVKECLTWGTEYQVEMQFAFINEKLTKKEIEILGMLTFDKEKEG